MYWLPPHGFGNGIPARAWAILADLSESQVAPTLFTLADAHIGAYVATEHITPMQPHDPTTVWRLWVDSLQYRHAEDILIEELRADHQPGSQQ
jgi:hypothetical protein